ncbi:MAG: hypothetical protein K8I29_11135 [Alphaproteobacteria bacterium]|uniref:Uncharacterized protein n=1 Tax=Candidatus Nitrobium versatile TaxID=2884831 RepID=A0A953JDW1_9BACT|nr:hypothetical protein [Candidatus Nitrobium versatile]
MAKRLIDVLRVLAKELIEKGYDADDMLKKVSGFDIDFLTVKEELLTLELTKYIDDAELDTIRALLAYILMKDTELETEEIYAFIFGKGRQITWN